MPACPIFRCQIVRLSYDDAVIAHRVFIQYEARLQELQAGLAQVRVQHLAAAAVLVIAAVMFLALGFFTVRERAPLWLPSLPIPVAAASARRYRRLGMHNSQMRRLQRFYRRAIQRVTGSWPGQGFT